MIRIVFFRKKVQHLVIDQLMEDVETRTLGRHLVIGFFQLLLQLVAAVTVEGLDIGTLAVRQVIIGGQLRIGQSDKGNAHPHIGHG